MLTYTIQEASRLAEVPKHTLRFWERALNGIIVPLRTRGGQRRYTKKHLLIIAEIKKLKKNGLSLTDIKNKLGVNRAEAGKTINPDKIDMLADHIAEVVKSSIYNFLADDEIEIID